jgi:hypothetical protein
MKRYIGPILALIALVVVVVGITMVVKNFILGGAAVNTTASKKPTTTQQIQQQVSSTDSTSPNPVFPTDVRVDDVKYFDGRTWLVAKVEQINVPGNFAYIIMQLQNGSYQTIAGPGTNFTGSMLPSSTPKDVWDYLSSL